MASPQQLPIAVICIGMAGSGKTTFMQRINAHLHHRYQQDTTDRAPPYVLNLDPAVRSVPFDANIDIRDSVNYKEVMKQYNLGPNGGILTSLNLFATKVDQVMGILEKRCLPQPEPAQQKPLPSHILIDTPGQIEVFVWSASGNILLNSLASSFPTVIAYIIDTPRTTENTSTFMSNMLYAISILYKTKLPMILVFNKTDVKSEEEAVDWMRDFESFQAALRKEEEAEQESGRSGYMDSLLNSMSLVLEEFYNSLSVVGVSSMTGAGIDEFFEAVEEKRQEFERDYRPELEKRRNEAQAMKAQLQEKEVSRMMKDMSMSGVSSKAKGTGKYRNQPGGSFAAHKVSIDDEPETVSDVEAMSDDEADNRGGLEERDDEEEMDEDIAFEESLKARYEAAMQDKSGPAVTLKSADYIRKTQG